MQKSGFRARRLGQLYARDAHRINSSGPRRGKRAGERSIALRTGSKSAALLWIRGILATRAVAAIIPSNLQRANRSWRDSAKWWERLGAVGGSGNSAIISPATTATAPSIGHPTPSAARYATRANSIISRRSPWLRRHSRL